MPVPKNGKSSGKKKKKVAVESPATEPTETEEENRVDFPLEYRLLGYQRQLDEARQRTAEAEDKAVNWEAAATFLKNELKKAQEDMQEMRATLEVLMGEKNGEEGKSSTGRKQGGKVRKDR